jgi:hypothetical protein
VKPKTTTRREPRSPWPRQTLSGAQVREIPETLAQTFLSRHSAPVLQASRLTLGAFEDSGALVGVLAVTGSSVEAATIHVVVTPERRRLKLATDLVQTLASDHTERIGRTYKFCNAVAVEAASVLRASIDSPRRIPLGQNEMSYHYEPVTFTLTTADQPSATLAAATVTDALQPWDYKRVHNAGRIVTVQVGLAPSTDHEANAAAQYLQQELRHVLEQAGIPNFTVRCSKHRHRTARP